MDTDKKRPMLKCLNSGNVTTNSVWQESSQLCGSPIRSTKFDSHRRIFVLAKSCTESRTFFYPQAQILIHATAWGQECYILKTIFGALA